LEGKQRENRRENRDGKTGTDHVFCYSSVSYEKCGEERTASIEIPVVAIGPGWR
jgi:hypothetical protein